MNRVYKIIVDLPHEDLPVIMQSQKTLLFSKKVPWVKKEREEDFDDGMLLQRRSL